MKRTKKTTLNLKKLPLSVSSALNLLKIILTGEANAGQRNPELYPCTFPALISEWRRKWPESSPTNSNFPFGFVQLAAYRGGVLANAFSEIRWHQTADYGFAPNPKLQVINCFYCVNLSCFYKLNLLYSHF